MAAQIQKPPYFGEKFFFFVHALVNNRLEIEYVIDCLKLMTTNFSHFHNHVPLHLINDK